MAWGSTKNPTPPPAASSSASKLLPLVILFLVLGAFAFVGYQVYVVATQIANSTNKKLETKNVTFTKDGMKVGVKEVKQENYVDQTQSGAAENGGAQTSAARNLEEAENKKAGSKDELMD
ncbi:MAG: hypothetical protein M1837_002042 [Sclerophora amabilis]|nr:MAG: hypothetical protein M1837_002042 [Sclerophora amabilis]